MTQIRIYRALLINGATVRDDIAFRLGIARSTVYDNLIKMKRRGLIKSFEMDQEGKGRPFKYWEVVK